MDIRVAVLCAAPHTSAIAPALEEASIAGEVAANVDFTNNEITFVRLPIDGLKAERLADLRAKDYAVAGP